MRYGYIRVSTRWQANDGNSIEAQKAALEAAGVDAYYIDTYTGGKMQRPQLNELINTLKPGDTIVVTKIDRFARTISQATETIELLLEKGIAIYILNLGILDSSSTSVLIRNIMLAFAQFERDLIIERTQEGKAIARQDPDYREGRPKKFREEQIRLALHLLETNSYRQVALMTGISESTIQRAKKAEKMRKKVD